VTVLDGDAEGTAARQEWRRNGESNPEPSNDDRDP